MFLGGADHEAERIRESSIKGALAFWWRALNYARFVGEADGADESAKLNNALAAMQKEEQKLFGGPDGQGVFLLRVHTATLNKLDKANILSTDGQAIKPTNGANPVGVGARYLGYGILEAFSSQKRGTFAGQLVRNCFAAGQTFSIEIIFRPTDDTKDIKEVIDALKLFGLLGGLGSRVRRGWGSVALVKLEGENLPEDMNVNWQEPESRKDYIARLKELFKDHPSLKQSGRDWPLTAFAKESRIHVGTDIRSNPLDTLNELGSGFLKYRSYGRSNKHTKIRKVGGVVVDASFDADHDWYYRTRDTNPCSRDAENWAPMRTAFGLPHNYSKFYGVTGPDKIERRASPFLFHVHHTDAGSFAVAAILPTRFLPNNKVGILRKPQRGQEQKCDKDYTFDPLIVTDFLDGFRHKDDKSQKPTSTPRNNPYFQNEVLRMDDEGSGQ